MTRDASEFLAYASSDSSGSESGYDSEAAEISKTAQRRRGEPARKRRRLSPQSDDSVSASEEDRNSLGARRKRGNEGTAVKAGDADNLSGSGVSSSDDGEEGEDGDNEIAARQSKTTDSQSKRKDTPSMTRKAKQVEPLTSAALPSILNAPDDLDENAPPDVLATSMDHSQPQKSSKNKKKQKDQAKREGVIYLPSLPPYLRPSALRNLLQQRGFGPITRLFLTPASTSTTKSTSASTKSSKSARKLYTEGWLALPTPSLAKRCVSTLNATPIGGKKGGYYRDDLWNMRYLKGVSWAELMDGVRNERAEAEAQREQERRGIERAAREFVKGVGEGRRWEGLEEGKRKKRGMVQGGGDGSTAAVVEYGGHENAVGRRSQRTWRQFEVKNAHDSSGVGPKRQKTPVTKHDDAGGVDQATQSVLSNIF
ncbi:Pre-rRNA-processing protein esf2 [Cyphellophora attinorum]|uniref:Pre-rRNA-processing protein esf2 n=1 Tax=Cyphellophora attinorum TaxID=1664694 RepID=A0A0N1NYC2_9EURO|nr:Pre-rRNA-processing protein esf2 [Phialophora attinorum]KPI39054.1 Pre-rRNA-processing protein esf2 [Phialophora attinorum]